jgi:hypothetical protein
MAKLIVIVTAGALLAIPGLVSAAPVYVEYETRIADFCNCEGTPYTAGQRLDGWLRIDPDLAPPGRLPNEPGQQLNAQYWETGRDFISGFGWPTTGFGNDEVAVTDDSGKFKHQGYSIWDHSYNPTATTVLQLQLYSDDVVDDFIHGMGLAQSFDTQTLEGNIQFRGFLTHKLKNGFQRTLSLVLDRLTVTPGQCRAP